MNPTHDCNAHHALDGFERWFFGGTPGPFDLDAPPPPAGPSDAPTNTAGPATLQEPARQRCCAPALA
ncbi:MAG: hypothetical protein EOP38_09295 [Rubrivivax sp.]|nr:MAG: hypothetical protein EOP38_09295 [Rubrivivax sp.]